MSKERWNLIRIIVCGVLLVPILVLEYAVDARWSEITVAVASAIAFLLVGYDVVIKSVRRILNGQFLDESFLMTIAAAGAFAIGEYPEAVAVMLFYQVGEYCEKRAVKRSRKSIKALLSINPDTAVRLVNGQENVVPCEEIAVGDLIVVRAGERIPVDGVVCEGDGNLDLSSLNGESLPRAVCVGNDVLSGAIVLDALLVVRATKVFAESTASRMIQLVQDAREKKAPVENFITTFAKYYTPIVVAIAVVLGVVVPLCVQYNDWPTWAYWLKKAMVFLVVSCPCALVISVPLTYFAAIGLAGRMGILIKGGHVFAMVTKLDTVAMDKTGTITEGRFAVRDVYPAERRNEVLHYAAICEQGSLHPVALSILAACDVPDTNGYSVRERRGLGMIAEGTHRIVCGNRRLLLEEGVSFDDLPHLDGTMVHVALDGEYVGTIAVSEKIKEDSVEAIDAMRKEGLRTIMLTGDHESVAANVAEVVHLDEYRAGMLPQDKVAEIESIRGVHTVAFVGDGINDAPVITAADIGVAMGGIGSDAAIESADVVLMQDSLMQVVKLRGLARKTQRIGKENIIFALGVKLAVMAVSITSFSRSVGMMWLAVGADVGVALLAILNAMRAGRKSQ